MILALIASLHALAVLSLMLVTNFLAFYCHHPGLILSFLSVSYRFCYIHYLHPSLSIINSSFRNCQLLLFLIIYVLLWPWLSSMCDSISKPVVQYFLGTWCLMAAFIIPACSAFITYIIWNPSITFICWWSRSIAGSLLQYFPLPRRHGMLCPDLENNYTGTRWTKHHMFTFSSNSIHQVSGQWVGDYGNNQYHGEQILGWF